MLKNRICISYCLLNKLTKQKYKNKVTFLSARDHEESVVVGDFIVHPIP